MTSKKLKCSASWGGSSSDKVLRFLQLSVVAYLNNFDANFLDNF